MQHVICDLYVTRLVMSIITNIQIVTMVMKGCHDSHNVTHCNIKFQKWHVQWPVMGASQLLISLNYT